MSYQTSINCPDCNSPIYIQSDALLQGASFSCSNPQCSVAISLSTSDMSTVSSAINQFEDLRQEAVNGSKNDGIGIAH